MIEQLWQLLTTFTPESQKAVINKSVEYGFDITRGDVSLEESYINLNASVLILKEAIEQKKLIQLPISIQKALLANLDAISKNQTNLLVGSDEILNLKNNIEALNTNIWQYGLFNLSDEVLGYQIKLNQLKQLELEATALNAELKEGIKLKKKIDEANQLAQEKLDAINVSLTRATNNLTKIEQFVVNSTDANQQVSAILVSAQQNETVITQSKATAIQNDAEITAIEQKIKDFFNAITAHKAEITTTATAAETAITTNTTKTNTLISTLTDLENQIKAQLQKATGFSLFHSFQTRQELIRKSKDFWTYTLAGLLVLTACLTWYLIHSITSADKSTALDIAFFLKLSLSIPLIFAISFCTIQYSRERRLEEEYAFKSNISISLVPYQELVEKLVAEDDVEQRKEYATFMMNTINKVFTSPTAEIFKDKNEGKSFINKKSLKDISELVEAVSKIKPT
ncbi:MAG: hypothetical protein ACXW1T_12135 [Methylophilus sp.]